VSPEPIAALPAAPPPKKKTSGCLIALFIVGGLALLLCLGGSVALWLASRTETGRKVLQTVEKSVKLAEKGINAPGAAEMRAAGCPQAVVLDMRDTLDVVSGFFDAGVMDLEAEGLQGAVLLCQGPFGSELPDCDGLASVYVEAVAPAQPFMVVVKRQGARTSNCERRYAADGAFIEELNRRK